eukprot:925164_1
MPILTRSMSRSLKRKRNEIDNTQPDNDESTIQDTSHLPRIKKQKLSDKMKQEQEEMKETSTDIDKENTTNSNNKPKPKKKLKNQKQSSKTKTNNKTDSKTEINRLKSKHRSLLESGYKCIVGVDEAGRGPLAGPVVIAAAYVPIDIFIDGITDSKKINAESEREKLYEIITSTKEIKYSVTIFDHKIIDEYNILESSLMGMRQCVQKLHDEIGVDYALCDGNRDPRFEYPETLKYEYIIKGDANIYCIGAASIIAKVTRDRIMIEYHKKYPIYKFKNNKGYPTPAHKQLVMDNGPCDIHRKSFRPVKDWYKQNKPKIHEKWETLKKQRAEERKKK